jgi:hypothetical protein
MSSNIDKYQERMAELANKGLELLRDLSSKNEKPPAAGAGARFSKEYEMWYTEAHEVVKQLIPSRLPEFELHYRPDVRRKEKIDASNYGIADYLLGISVTDMYGDEAFDSLASVTMRFHRQVKILQSADTRFASVLMDIRTILQADLFDSELEAAKELRKKGFLRAAGAVAGVVLEAHLAQVVESHGIKIKANPHISDLNDALKTTEIIDVASWRFVQHLGDLRNLCDHNKAQEPTQEQVSELINGVDKVAKTIF